MEYNESWNGDSHNLTHTRDDLKYTPEQFEEKLSEYVQKLTINLENKYIKVRFSFVKHLVDTTSVC